MMSPESQMSNYIHGFRDRIPIFDILFKGGISPEFRCDVKRFKEGIKERKLFLKHHQTDDPHATAPQVSRGLFGCPCQIF